MFLGDPAQWFPPPPDPPRRSNDRALGWLIGLNLLFAVIAPVGGVTVLQPLLAWLRG